MATATSLHLCLSTPNVGMQELTALSELVSVKVSFADGNLLPPDWPGLCIEFNEEAVGAYPAMPKETALGYRRVDGSFTNW